MRVKAYKKENTGGVFLKDNPNDIVEKFSALPQAENTFGS